MWHDLFLRRYFKKSSGADMHKRLAGVWTNGMQYSCGDSVRGRIGDCLIVEDVDSLALMRSGYGTTTTRRFKTDRPPLAHVHVNIAICTICVVNGRFCISCTCLTSASLCIIGK